MEGEDDEAAEEAGLGRHLRAHLAAAMWEVLVCCAGDLGDQLCGAGLLELCGGEVSLCSLFARHVLEAHVPLQAVLAGLSQAEQAQAVSRVRGLQESLTRAYVKLYQPATVWGHDGPGPGDAPMAELQQRLHAHISRVGDSAVQFGVLVALTHAADFHLSWTSARLQGCALPLALPVLICQLVCTIIESSSCSSSGALRRHIQILMPGLLIVVKTSVEFVSEQLQTGCRSSSDLMVAVRAALDLLVGLSANGLWCMPPETAGGVASITDRVLATTLACSEPAVLARLTLVLVQQPLNSGVLEAYRSLDAPAQAAFWQQLRSRACLRGLEPGEALSLAQGWLGEPHPPPADQVQATKCAGLDGGGLAVQEVAPDIDHFIERCLAELPQSLREMQTAMLTVEAAADGTACKAPAGSTAAADGPAVGGFGMLDLPALPGMQPKGGAAADAAAGGKPARRIQKLARADIAKMRGVDPTAAPADLRCDIDGKLLGTPLRSPHGHLFEKDTLEQWLSRCGSICPVTGKPLRLENCKPDRAVERQVVQWVKAAKAEHKREVQKRREQHSKKTAGADLDVLL